MSRNPYFAVFSDVDLHWGEKKITCTYRDFLRKGIGYCLYKGLDAEDSKTYCVKFYTEKNPDEARKANHDKVCHFIEGNSTHNGLPSILGHGTARVFTGDESAKYLYEILPAEAEYAVPLSSMMPLDQKQILEFLPPVVQGLGALHRAGFIHGHISPESMEKDKHGRITLANFDWAHFVIQDDAGFAFTDDYDSEYSAPEAHWNHLCAASDIYGTGMTLLSLIHGRFYLDEDLSVDSYEVREKLNQLIVSNSLPLPVNWNESDGMSSKMKHLILGCLQERPGDRFSLSDIESFCMQREAWNPPAIRQQSGALNFVLWDNSRVFTRKGFIQILCERWDEALRFYNRRYLESSLANAGLMREATFVRESLERVSRKHGDKAAIDISLSQCLSIIYPDHTCVYYKGGVYSSLIEIADKAQSDKTIQGYLKELLKGKFISWFFQQKNINDGVGIEQLEKAACQDSFTSDIALWTLIYFFSKKNNQGWVAAQSEDEWAQLFDQYIPDCNQALRLLESPQAIGWLNYCRKVFFDLSPLRKMDDTLKVIALFRQFAPNCPEHAKAAFKAYGPYAFFRYLQRHTDLYDFPKAYHQLKQTIVQFRNAEDGMIDALLLRNKDEKSVQTYFGEIQLIMVQFRKALDNNLLAMSLGIRSDAERIRPRAAGAFLTERYCGELVSPGFIRNLEQCQGIEITYHTAEQDAAQVEPQLVQRKTQLESHLSFFKSCDNSLTEYLRSWSKWYIVCLLLACLVPFASMPGLRTVFHKVNLLLGYAYYPAFSGVNQFLTNTLLSSIPYVFLLFAFIEVLYRKRRDRFYDDQAQQILRIKNYALEINCLHLDTVVGEVRKALKKNCQPDVFHGIDDTMDEFAHIVEQYRHPTSSWKGKILRISISAMLSFALVLLSALPAFKAILRLATKSDMPMYIWNVSMFILRLCLSYDVTSNLFVLASALYSLIYTGIATTIALCYKNTGGVFYVTACLAGNAAVLCVIAFICDVPILVLLLIVFFSILKAVRT